MQIWNDLTKPYLLQAGKKYTNPTTITVDPGTGDIQLQFKNASGAWVTPSDPAYTITAFNVIELKRTNMPEINIIATGAAKFSVSGAQ